MSEEQLLAIRAAAEHDGDLPCRECSGLTWWGALWSYDGKCEQCSFRSDDEYDHDDQCEGGTC